MKGYIEWRGKSARLDVHIGNGQRLRRTIKNAGRRQAQDALNDLIREARGLSPTASGPVTVSELVSQYLDANPTGVADNTLNSYRIYSRIIDKDALGASVAGAKLGPKDVEKLIARVALSGKSPATVTSVRLLLGQAFRWGVHEGLVPRNPVADAAVGRKRQAEPLPELDDEAVAAVLKIAMADSLMWGTGFALCAQGVRRGELCGLRWRYVDWQNGRIIIEWSEVIVPGGVLRKGPKNRRGRAVNLGDFGMQVLSAWFDECERKGCAQPDHYVLSPRADHTEPYNPNSVTHQWVRYCKRAKVAGLRLHDTRHWSATTRLKAGRPVYEVMEQLGWTSMSTMRRYVHWSQTQDRSSAEPTDGVLGGLLGAVTP